MAAQRIRMLQGIRCREDDTDRIRILDYFRGNTSKIIEVLENNIQNMQKLAQRRGTEYDNPIIDTGNRELRGKFSRLAEYYKKGISISDRELIENLGELLNKIRNNLFHGGKVYDDGEDIALLQLVNPILLDILRKCESI